MAAHAFFTADTFQTGDLVCVDESTGYAVEYDENLPVIGVAIVPVNGRAPNGRNWFCINGNPYYLNDQWVWEEDLTSDFITENLSYSPFNPLVDAGYITAITNGIAAVKKSILTGIPSSWIRIRIGLEFDWYLVK